MTTKEALTDEFNNAKWAAEAKLDRVVVKSSMTPDFIQAQKNIIEHADQNYIKMFQCHGKLKTLPDDTITGDDLDSLKADIDDVRGKLNNCTDK